MPKKCGMKLFILIFMIVANFTFVNAATVRFYDDSLNLVRTGNYETGDIVDFTQIKSDFKDITFWYTAGGSIPLDNYTVTEDINLYSVPQVKEILSEYYLGEMEDIRKFVGGRYMLMSDIKLTKVWIPIGDNKNPFTGIFNGGGHTISGLWTDNTSTDFVGLFGLTYGAIIKNVKVSIDAEKGGLSGRSHIGAIVGSAINTTIINSHSEGIIRGGVIVGGVVGSSISTMIKGSSSSCDIEAHAGAGGIVGIGSRSYFEKVSSSGTIILREYSSNLTDLYKKARVHDVFLDYENDISTNLIQYNSFYNDRYNDREIGGIVGSSYFVTIADSYFTGNIKGGQFSGGITGQMHFGGIANSHVVGNIEGYDYSGGIVGDISYTNIINSSFKGTIKGMEKVGGIAGNTVIVDIVNNSVEGDIEGINYSGGIVGSLNGSNIIRNYFKGKIKGVAEIGGIVGEQYNCSHVEDSYAQGDIEGESKVGGLVGTISSSATSFSYFSGKVKGVNYIGGVAGDTGIDTIISSTYSDGIVVGESAVGGVTGRLSAFSLLMNSYSSADISGKENVGGIAGISIKGKCYDDKFEPPVFGDCPYFSKINDVYFLGKVKGEGRYTGGIVGYNECFIINSYVLGSVEGRKYVGGIVGYTKGDGYDNSGEMVSLLMGNLAANSLIKGVNTARIAAVIDGEQKSVPHNFALSTLNKGFTDFSEGDARNGISKTAKELKKEITYSTAPPEGLGWKFWNDIENKYKDGDYQWLMEGSTTGYPILYWQIIETESGRAWSCKAE
jgi:hypothetical protein